MPTPEILARRQQRQQRAQHVQETRTQRQQVKQKHQEELSQVFSRQADEIKPFEGAVHMNEDQHEAARVQLLRELPRTAARVLSEFVALWNETRKSRLKPKKRAG